MSQKDKNKIKIRITFKNWTHITDNKLTKSF